MSPADDVQALVVYVDAEAVDRVRLGLAPSSVAAKIDAEAAARTEATGTVPVPQGTVPLPAVRVAPSDAVPIADPAPSVEHEETALVLASHR